MPINAKYVHTNIVARDWKALVKFYQAVFGCEPMPPARDYKGKWINDVTALTQDVTIAGIHLRMPGYEKGGPTLEIFEYNSYVDDLPPAANRRGFAHIAFHVEDVQAARQAVLAGGGHDLGKLHTMEVAGAGIITLIYMTDPEGNIIELQNWKR